MIQEHNAEASITEVRKISANRTRSSYTVQSGFTNALYMLL